MFSQEAPSKPSQLYIVFFSFPSKIGTHGLVMKKWTCDEEAEHVSFCHPAKRKRQVEVITVAKFIRGITKN